MGTSTIFDIIGSTVVAGMLLLIALRLNAQSLETTATYQANYALQDNLVNLIDIIENDFRKIGYCRNFAAIAPGSSIDRATDSSIVFLADLPMNPSNPYDVGDGIVDTVYYYIGLPDNTTPNPDDRFFHRNVVSAIATSRATWSLGMVGFHIRYYAALGDDITDSLGISATPANINSMEIAFSLASFAPVVAYSDSLATAEDYKVYWRQVRVANRNLRTR